MNQCTKLVQKMNKNKYGNEQFDSSLKIILLIKIFDCWVLNILISDL